MFATRWTTASLVIAGLCLASPAGAGQSAGEATGAIEGTVTDSTGAALQHVVVRASGPPLIKPVDVTSGAGGHYRVQGLPLGTYQVTFTLSGFSTDPRAALVSAGTTTRLSVTLDVTRTSEVTVDGSARTFSPRGTTLSAAFDEDDLARLPGSRTVAATLATSAGMYATRAAVGSSLAVAPAPFGAYGTSGSQRPTIDGTSVSGMQGGGRLSGHLFKAGGEAQRLVDAETWFQSYPGDVLHVRHNGVAQEVYLYQTPSRSESGQWWFTAFANDSWRLHDRLTVELGVRFESVPDLPAPAGPSRRPLQSGRLDVRSRARPGRLEHGGAAARRGLRPDRRRSHAAADDLRQISAVTRHGPRVQPESERANLVRPVSMG